MTNPYDVVTVVNTSAASAKLTDLATVKDELTISLTDNGSDGFLNRALAQISTAIANYCNRVFPVETLTDTFFFARRWRTHQHLNSDDVLQLTRFPVVAITSVIETAADGTATTLVQNTDYLLRADVGQLIRIDASNNGFTTRWKCAEVAAKYSAGYGSAVSEAKTIPASPPYAVTVTQAPVFSVDLGVTGIAGTYTVASATGIYTFTATDAGKSVTINYAITTIPDDLVDAALRLITARYKAKGRDPAMMSRDLPTAGNERYWVGSAPGQDGAFPPEIAGLLDGKYRVPVIG